MATAKTISTYYDSYNIADGVNLYITRSGFVGGEGILAIYNTTVTNEGGVNGGKYGGVNFGAGGVLINGSASYTGAFVEGRYGVEINGGSGYIGNFGLIEGVASITGSGDGIDLFDGGVVVNGSFADHYAEVLGNTGISISGATGEVSNLGTVRGQATNGYGVQLLDGGSVGNGTNRDTTASIAGYSGVRISGGGGEVTNYGTIDALGEGTAVYLADGGTVLNGSGTQRTALIEGAGGVDIAGAAGEVRNSGTILATANAFAVELLAGGSLSNGSPTNGAALIQGYAGVFLDGASALNLGTIVGVGGYAIGVRMAGGASIINGSASRANALIESYLGVYAPGDGIETVTNFGTIEGEGTDGAIDFHAGGDLLNVEAGSVFIGAVYGGGGTLNLASGTGTIANLGAVALTVTGSMAATTFEAFNTVEVGAGATFTAAAALTLAATQTVNSAGTLTLGAAGKAVTSAGLIETTGAGLLTITGALKNTGTIAADGGTLTVKGAVTGTGGVGRIDGGTLDLAAGFTQNVTFTGTTGVLELAQSQGYTGDVFGFSKTGKTSLDLLDITFGKSTTATFSGTTAGGVLTVTDGTHTAKINLKGNYTTSTFVTSSDGHGGTTVVDPKAKAPALAPAHQFIAAAANLGGLAGGAIQVGNAWIAPAPMLARPGTATA